MLNKKHYEKNEEYDGENLVVGIRFGSDGIIPCHKGCMGSCIGSSGDNRCGGYGGHEQVKVDGTDLFIVRCVAGVKCKCHD